jgi:predicted DNA-binding transcriptional regulator YafY
VRKFAVQRIAQARMLEDTFDPDPEFCLTDYVSEGFGAMGGSPADIVIDFDATVAHLIRERRFHRSQRVEERPGGVRLQLTAAGLPEIAAWLAGFGGHACALEPPELVEAVAEIHRAGLVRHAGEPKKAAPQPKAPAGTVRRTGGAEAETGEHKAGGR